MKRWIVAFLLLALVLAFAGCRQNNSYTISMTVPAGTTEELIISAEAVSATGKKITIIAGQELGDAKVILMPVDETVTPGYVATYITPQMPVSFDATPGQWFQVGIYTQNETDTDKTISVTVSGVELKTE